MVKKKILTITIVALLSVSLIGLGLTQTQAMSQILVIGPGGAKDVGSSFTTTETVTRSDLVDFLEDVKYAEDREGDLNDVRFAMASAAVIHPISRAVGAAIGASGGSQIIANLILNRGLSSDNIQDVLNDSTAKNFKISIKYEKGTRGQDKWYEATAMSVNPA